MSPTYTFLVDKIGSIEIASTKPNDLTTPASGFLLKNILYRNKIYSQFIVKK